MTLQEFCDYLIAEEEYGADMTLNGILHYLAKKRHTAIVERNMDEYKRLKKLGDEIYNARDMARLQRKLQVAE